METAVQKLIKKMEALRPLLDEENNAYEDCVFYANEALEEEKQQIMDAYAKGIARSFDFLNPFDYYNKTYNNKP